jgi:peptidoglycan/LPS O-acetylase OafA/YrhL
LLQDVLYLEAFSAAGVWCSGHRFSVVCDGHCVCLVGRAWQRVSRHGSVIRKALVFWAILTLVSIFLWNLNPLGEVWGTCFQCLRFGFVCGVLALRRFAFQLHQLGFVNDVGGGSGHCLPTRIRLVVAVITSVVLSFYEAGNCRPIEALKWPWLRELSNASYAIFLIHFGTSLLVSAVVFNFWSENIPINLMGLLFAFAASVGLGRQMPLAH